MLPRLKKTILKTGDGSVTIHLPDWNEQYHSTHGALAEAVYVFIKQGLHYQIETTNSSEIAILEVGFGTGLNALLTFLEADQQHLNIDYTALEAYPLTMSEIEQLNYAELLTISPELYHKLHRCSWESKHELSDMFKLTKRQLFFEQLDTIDTYDLVYFDAFGIRVQPELWSEAIFSRLYRSLKHNGVLVTYAANGSARRAMVQCGFKVDRLPGPPGKRQMMRATKL